LNAGQISVACALDYIDFRHGDRDWQSRHPKMADWQAKMQALDAFKQTMPEG
jgi:glutathione S-transferase